MRVLICPDKFKGSASAAEVCVAIAAGLADRLGRGVGVESVPLADGGDGTLAVLAATPGAQILTAVVTGPLGEPVQAQWALLADGTAVIEMAQASGLALITGPLRAVAATTFGTGELIRLAIDAGATRCVVGVGGSATTDGGLGALDALGWSLHGMSVQVATDVTTLFMEAARVFGPQKGASPDEVVLLTRRLESLADRYHAELGRDIRNLERSGAAGGLAGGLAALGANLVSGFDMVADVVGLDEALERADAVVTGEGRYDETSFVGKPVGEVLKRARRLGLSVVVVCGSSDPALHHLADGVIRLVDLAPTPEQAMADPTPWLREAGRLLGASLDQQPTGRLARHTVDLPPS